jgi:hypothetical protein
METCSICKCRVHRGGDYALPTPKGRGHRTEHHYVAERFFGRSLNRPGTQREAIFEKCPWTLQRKTGVYCYECHEELLHNPVFLPEDIARFSELVTRRGLTETAKTKDRSALAGRIELLHDVISAGIRTLLDSRAIRPAANCKAHPSRC